MPSWFSRRVVAVPFGHYEAGVDQEPPANEVLIGREGQRAFFIDLLLNMGRRGAYLVTGRRGAGKTSFVRYCIGEYQAEVYGRYLRSSVSRALLWDRFIVLALFTITILAALLLSQLLDILVRSFGAADSGSGSRSLLLWMLVAPVALLCVYPLLYAKELLEVVFIAGWTRNGARYMGPLVVVIWGVVAWLSPPFGSPALGMSRLFVAIALVSLLVQIGSYRGNERPLEKITRWQRAALVGVHAAVLGVGLGYVYWGADPLGIAAPSEFWFNVALGFLFIAAITSLRGFFQLRLGADHATAAEVKADGALWYWTAAAFTTLVAIAVLARYADAVEWRIAVSPPLFLLAIGIGVIRLLDGERHVFQPRPLYTLTAKALVSVVLGLQLFHPALAHWLAHSLGVGGSPAGNVTVDQRGPVSLHAVRALWEPLSPSVHHADTLHHEIHWIVALLLIAQLLFFLEYEWVVRPFHRQRIDRAFADYPAPWDDQEGSREDADRRQVQRRLASATFPWVLYREWLPVLVMAVNLGFERLDHRRVVHSMLASLRDRYYRTFLAWNSWLANLGRTVALLVMLALTTLIGEQFFDLRADPVPAPVTVAPPAKPLSKAVELSRKSGPMNVPLAPAAPADVCGKLSARDKRGSALSLICILPFGDQLFHALYFDLGPSRFRNAYGAEHLLFWFLPYQREGLSAADVGSSLAAKGLHFRIYHALTFLFLFILAKWAVRRLPYHETLRRLDSMLDSLSSRTSITTTKLKWKPAQWIQGHFQDENQRHVEQDPIDPRTLEFAFLTILHDIQRAPLLLPGARNQLISLPTPEITFIFDELDKLGTRQGATDSGGGEQQEVEILDRERRRSIELHRLLADMKNVLSSAPARFVFVGGRNLHDEWLADQTARHPLLTNIFNAEIYLPSLLTDQGWKEPTPRLHHQIERYLLRQAWRASVLYNRWIQARWLPSFGQPQRSLEGESFVGPAGDAEPEGANRHWLAAWKRWWLELPRRLLARTTVEPEADEGRPRYSKLTDLKVLQCDLDGRPSGTTKLDAEGGRELLQDFVAFMTYRSMGNPKRLKELLARFVRPAARTVREPWIRWHRDFDCRHVLAFGDVERFRVQLLADIYRHLTRAFERRLVVRDDKLTVSVFFLADYLFKFHRRAFSWSNLERVDELLDVHRAPDLREIMQEILEHWSERFLHPIRNGMYAFRFRSDMAREIEYLSRQSAHEMAAFNFTLDESLALKSLYADRIQRLPAEAHQQLQDLLAGVGELHEFDQEYEVARQHYRRSIRMLDLELAELVGTSGTEETPPTLPALAASGKGPENMRLYLTWGAARLRLMLQIGLTFEFARNFERAAVEYRNARTLARSLTTAFLGSPELAASDSGDDDSEERRIHVLKNLNILFQPVFAEAWVAEKLGGGVDTSGSLIEKEIWALRMQIPFISDFRLKLSRSAADVRGSNFALIAAELHNKTGDLYFFKGRELISNLELEKAQKWLADGKVRRGSEGYLLRAHYHYAMGLHELRRFATHRWLSSKDKFNIWSEKAFGGEPLWPTLSASGFPDYVFRAVGGTLNDLAETMLGRVSLYGLFRPAVDPRPATQAQRKTAAAAADPQAPKELKGDLVVAFDRWLTTANLFDANDQPLPEPDGRERSSSIAIPLPSGDLQAGSLESWLGEWDPDATATDKRILRFDDAANHDDRRRLAVSLLFTLVGAKYFERGGYLEDAASELFEVCETVTYYLWWGLAIRRIGEWFEELAARETANKASADATGASTGPGSKDVIDRSVLLEDPAFFKGLRLDDEYWVFLYDLAVYALRKADQLYQRSRHRGRDTDGSSGRWRLGNELPPSVLTLACSLGLAAAVIHGDSFRKGQQALLNLVKGWTGDDDSTPATRLPIQDYLSNVVERSLLRHSYPMINRLQGLKTLIDWDVTKNLAVLGRQQVERILSRAEELLTLQELFDAPMHFTPLQSGLTCGLVDLCFRRHALHGWTSSGELAYSQLADMFPDCARPAGKAGHTELDRLANRLADIRLAGQRQLKASEEMYTMRRGYYAAISNLYYLFDDFNDRPIHFNMAMQMAGTELASLVGGLLHWPEVAAFRAAKDEQVPRNGQVPETAQVPSA